MSVLDRAIVKAFQRRRDSEAVAKAAAVERCAVEESPTKPVVEMPSSSAFLNSESPAIGSYQQQVQPPLPPPLPKDESFVSDAIVATMAPRPIQSEPIASTPAALPERQPHRPEPELQPPVVQLQSAPVSNGRATYTSSFPRTSEPAPYVDNSVIKSPRATVGYAVTEMSAVAPPPLPPVIERPVPQQWKWPEICEQLDQFTGEGFRQLAKHLQFAAEQGHKTLAFVSSAPGAGRTSVLLTLTRILALEGKTDVLLIDADRRHPQLASLTAPQPTAGLREVLHGQLRMEQAVIPMNPGRVSVLPLNENLTDGEWLQLVAPMRVLLKQARRDYDMILIDAGVLGPETRLADCWLRGAADAVITISRQLTGKRTEHEVLDWKQIGIESLGVIETFA
ncbi:MAG: cpsD [Planctomycetaceae bacterium]|nr:cpsD [Planctomycetaceae bacterium]